LILVRACSTLNAAIVAPGYPNENNESYIA
jgi:hypothetical protein